MSATADLVRSIEGQVKTATDAIDRDRAEWNATRASEREERERLETRLKGLEDLTVQIQENLEEKRRTMLPGSEPGARASDRFSLARACIAINNRDWSGAELEKEVFDNMKAKAMSSGVDSAGGFIVPDEAIPQVIEALKAQIVALQLGARELPATGSPIMIPRISTSVSANWMTGENTTITASDLGLEQIEMSPKSLAARVILANQLLEMSRPAADSVVEEDLVSQLAIGMDKGVIEGTGQTGQPRGIIEDQNVLTEAISATITFTELQGFPDALAVANSLRGKLGWAMHPSMYTQLMQITSSGTDQTAAWTSTDIVRHIVTESAPTSILGYPFATTTSFTATTDADSIIFGNWDDVLIAIWGGLRLKASDTSDDAFSKDQTHIRGIMRADTALRHSNSFVIAT